jgi:hypothetical protein
MKKNLKQASKMKTKGNGGSGMAVGASILTAAALAGAAAYLLSGKEGEKRRAKMKTWAAKAHKEVAQRVKESRQMGEAQYKKIVDEAVKRYGSLEKVNVQDLVKVAQDMKSDWKHFQKHAATMAGMVQKKAAKIKNVSAKKSVKKTTKTIKKKAAQR